MGEFSSHVLEYLMSMRFGEPDPWYADDYQISYLTVLWAERGHPHPDVYATQLTLGILPSEVWPQIVARRRAKLGKLYTKFFYASTDLPRPDQEEDRKPPSSERSTTTARKSLRG